jgi:hypothetical protein
MHETERLSVLIGDIYDAALNPALWVGVLGKTRAFIGGCAIALSWKDAVAKRGGSYFDEGNLALLWQIYSRCFSSLIQDRQYGHR